MEVEFSTDIKDQNNIASILYFIDFLKSLIHERKCSTPLNKEKAQGIETYNHMYIEELLLFSHLKKNEIPNPDKRNNLW